MVERTPAQIERDRLEYEEALREQQQFERSPQGRRYSRILVWGFVSFCMVFYYIPSLAEGLRKVQRDGFAPGGSVADFFVTWFLLTAAACVPFVCFWLFWRAITRRASYTTGFWMRTLGRGFIRLCVLFAVVGAGMLVLLLPIFLRSK